MSFKHGLAALLITAACLNAKDIKNGICWGLCRNDGFDLGYFEEKTNSCICGARMKFKEITEKQIRVVPKKKKNDWEDD